MLFFVLYYACAQADKSIDIPTQDTVEPSTDDSSEPIDSASPEDTVDTSEPDDPPSLYFPPLDSEEWESLEPELAFPNWNAEALPPLQDYLQERYTKSFMILVDGKIVLEEYYGDHDADSFWYWASAGKTLTTAVVGIAEQEGYLQLDSPVSDYLEAGWTSAPPDKEALISSRHLLTMTSGLDDSLGDNVEPANLQYVADAGTRWAYHNAYVKLQDVVATATGQAWAIYFRSKLRNRIGMTGAWFDIGDGLRVYGSNTRSMARFGLLALAQGTWDGDVIVDEAFFSASTQPSQEINKSYGYLWWLNGQESYRLPQAQLEFPGSMIPNAPDDMVMALGKNDQKIYVVPSQNMVVIRMGELAYESTLALSSFDNELWEKINALIE